MNDEHAHTHAPLAPSTPVSVVVVNYEGAGHLEQTLPAIASKYLGATLGTLEDVVGKGKKALPTPLLPQQ